MESVLISVIITIIGPVRIIIDEYVSDGFLGDSLFSTFLAFLLTIIAMVLIFLYTGLYITPVVGTLSFLVFWIWGFIILIRNAQYGILIFYIAGFLIASFYRVITSICIRNGKWDDDKKLINRLKEAISKPQDDEPNKED